MSRTPPSIRGHTPGPASHYRALVLALTLAGGLSFAPSHVSAQDAASLDPSELLEEAHDRQQEFERYRASRIPVVADRRRPSCDEIIGRICIWYGGEGETRFPREAPEVGEARVELIQFLREAWARAPDRWLLGQLVFYLIEDRNVDEATSVARQCGIPETWWCAAQRGYILHLTTDYVASEAAFREALSLMPAEERDRWTSLHFLLTGDGEKTFERLPPDQRARQWELFWRLSDPIFLYEGNDRLTDHFARLVEATNWRDSANPLGMSWGEDMEATLIRYGRNIGYSRTFDPVQTLTERTDTRRVQGHHHPNSRGYLFPEKFLESPSDIPPESWITAPREARTWYAPLYAPDMRALETQVGRFRRGDEMFVVGAYRPVPPSPDSMATGARGTGEGDSGATRAGTRSGRGSAAGNTETGARRSAGNARAGGTPSPPANAEFGIEGQAHAAFFLVPEDGSEPRFVTGDQPEGVLTMYSAPGRFVSGLEVVDPQGRHGWRARQGVVQLPLEPGAIDVSDLLILKEGTPLPNSLEEAIPYVRPGVRIRQDERFPVVWEAYGLDVDEPVRVTLGFTRGRPGFLARVGDFLGIIEPDTPVEVSFQDPGPGIVQTAFRSIVLGLPDLDPGEYTLHLKLEIAGHEPVVTSRPIIVER